MTEDQFEQEALGWLNDVGYALANGSLKSLLMARIPNALITRTRCCHSDCVRRSTALTQTFPCGA
jgi:hypothetical protein